MRIITQGKTINLDSFGLMGYNFDKAMVYFGLGVTEEEFYFSSRENAMSFMDELIAAIANKREEIDMTHYSIYFATIYISQLKEYYRKEEEKYECNENR